MVGNQWLLSEINGITSMCIQAGVWLQYCRWQNKAIRHNIQLKRSE